MDKVLYAIENFKNMQELIRFADQKAGAIIVVYGFILSMAFETSKPLVFFVPDRTNVNALGVVTFVVGAVLVYLIATQIFYIFNSILKPRLAKNYNNSESCLYYFEHVAATDKAEVMSCFSNMDEKTMISDVASQIYEVSNTLNTKMLTVNNAINKLIHVFLCMFAFMLLCKII